jgi:hypothetical protein
MSELPRSKHALDNLSRDVTATKLSLSASHEHVASADNIMYEARKMGTYPRS